MSMKAPYSTDTRASAAPQSPSSTSQLVCACAFLSTPQPMVALPWGSRSMSNTRRLVAVSEAARFTAVVVLPTPPFWFATAMTRFMGKGTSCRSRRAPAAGRVLRFRPLRRSGPGTREFHNMPLVVQPRELDPVHGQDPEGLGQRRDLFVGPLAL